MAVETLSSSLEAFSEWGSEDSRQAVPSVLVDQVGLERPFVRRGLVVPAKAIRESIILRNECYAARLLALKIGIRPYCTCTVLVLYGARHRRLWFSIFLRAYRIRPVLYSYRTGTVQSSVRQDQSSREYCTALGFDHYDRTVPYYGPYCPRTVLVRYKARCVEISPVLTTVRLRLPIFTTVPYRNTALMYDVVYWYGTT